MWSLAHLDPFYIGRHLAQYMFCLWGSKDNDQLLSWITTTSQKVVLFFDGCWEQCTNYKSFMIYCLHKHDYCLDAERIFCNGTWKRSLQRPMNTQILDYQVMLNVFEEDMIKIKFFGIIKETIDEWKHCSRCMKQPPLHNTIIIQICTQAIKWRRVSCWYSWF